MYKFDHKDRPAHKSLLAPGKDGGSPGHGPVRHGSDHGGQGCDKVVERQVVGRILRQRAILDHGQGQPFPPGGK